MWLLALIHQNFFFAFQLMQRKDMHLNTDNNNGHILYVIAGDSVRSYGQRGCDQVRHQAILICIDTKSCLEDSHK